MSIPLLLVALLTSALSVTAIKQYSLKSSIFRNRGGSIDIQNEDANVTHGFSNYQRINDTHEVADPEIFALLGKYKSRIVRCHSPFFPHCDIFLCGTIHVAKTSADMVANVISAVKPHYVVIELCEGRADSLSDVEPMNITLIDVMRESISERSIKVFGMGILSWMQSKAAKMMGNKLGGELMAAAKAGVQQNATIILGDRLYGVTVQRIFDKLKLFEKLKMIFILFFEVLNMLVFVLFISFFHFYFLQIVYAGSYNELFQTARLH